MVDLYDRMQAALARLKEAQRRGRYDGPEGVEFGDLARAYLEASRAFHELAVDQSDQLSRRLWQRSPDGG